MTFDYEETIRNAFAQWSSFGNIEFMQIEDQGGDAGVGKVADIRIFFGPIPGGTAGWAFFPSSFGSAIAGDVLIDTLSSFNTNPDLFAAIVIHELGHALGLDHVDANSVMTPIVSESTLQQDDIDGIQQIYGVQDNAPVVYDMPTAQAALTILDVEADATINANDLNNSITGTDVREKMYGANGNDTISGNGGHDVISGQDGDDLIFGGDQNDRLHGGSGNDTIYGGNGRDTAFLGEGDDLFQDNSQDGFYGQDTVYANAGSDTIQGGDGDDSFYGQRGSDLIYGGLGNDQLFGGSQFDTIHGGDGNDTIDGGNGRDLIFMGDGNDVFQDNTQNDHFGRDTVHGGAGNDTFLAGGGNDIYTGDAGADIFVFNVGLGRDIITDFEIGIDVLRFDDALWSGVLSAAEVVSTFASTSLAGDVVFDFGFDTVTLEGLTSTAGLSDDLAIV